MDEIHVMFTVSLSGVVGWTLGYFTKIIGPASVIPLIAAVFGFVISMFNIVYVL